MFMCTPKPQTIGRRPTNPRCIKLWKKYGTCKSLCEKAEVSKTPRSTDELALRQDVVFPPVLSPPFRDFRGYSHRVTLEPLYRAHTLFLKLCVTPFLFRLLATVLVEDPCRSGS